jgi:hypothetical protein
MTIVHNLRRPATLAASLVATALLLPVVAPAQEQQSQPQQAQEQRTDERAVQEEVALRYRVKELQREAATLRNEYGRARSVTDQLETSLRQMRLDGLEGDELARLNDELQVAMTRARDLAARLDVAEVAAAEAESSLALFHDRKLLEQQKQHQIEQREQLRQSADQQQRAMAQAEQTLAEARQLAQGDNPAAAIGQALAQTEVQKLQRQYAALQQQAEHARALAERGVATAQELIELEARADMALAELREAELRRLLEQVQREQDGFEARNAQEPQPTDQEQSREAVLQTAFFRGYLDTVKQYAELSSDPEAAAVAAVVTAADLLRDQPPQASIEYFEPLLQELHQKRVDTFGASHPRSTMPTAVEAAVRMQLAEAYNAAGDRGRALEVLRGVILWTPTTTRPDAGTE